METNNSQEFKDYFNECLIINKISDEFDDDDVSKRSNESDFEAEWLRNLGFDALVANIEAGKEIEDEHYAPFFMSLNTRQAATVKKKITTLKTTVRKRKNTRSKVRDVRDVFPHHGESSSGGTRSRSATPDSLDSISPTDSPPSLMIMHDETWYPSATNGSPTPSQGYHSNTRSSPDVIDSPGMMIRGTSNRDVLSYTNSRGRRSPADGCSTPDIVEREPDFLQIFKAPVMKETSLAQESSEGTKLRGRSDSFLRSKGIHQSLYEMPILRPHSRHVYDLPSAGNVDTDTGIEILDYHRFGSICPHTGKQLVTQNLSYGLSDSDISLELKDEQDLNSEFTWGFEIVRKTFDSNDDWPELRPCGGKTGITRIDDLGAEDVKKIRTLSLIELATLFDLYNIQYSRRKGTKKKKKEKDPNVFGVALTALIEQDRRIQPDTKIPLVMAKIFGHLEKYGLKEEGILRVPGVSAKVDVTKQDIEMNFYSSPALVESALKSCSVNDVVMLMKRFLRELPVPLLTNEYMDAFFQVDKISDKLDQIKALKLLVILLPDAHRDLLKRLFDFLTKIVKHESDNRMDLQNVAMIIAPNLFLPKKHKKNTERDVEKELSMAAVTCKLTKMMIKYKEVLWTVPNFLVQQIRQQNEAALYQRRNNRENGKYMKILRGKPKKADIYRKINNEVDFQDGIIRVSALQFGKQNIPFKLEDSTTAGDVVYKIIRESRLNADYENKLKGRKDAWKRVPGNISPICLHLQNSSGFDEAHSLYEISGNIVERCLSPEANMIAVYQQNPNAEWEIRCKHNTSQAIVKEVILM